MKKSLKNVKKIDTPYTPLNPPKEMFSFYQIYL